MIFDLKQQKPFLYFFRYFSAYINLLIALLIDWLFLKWTLLIILEHPPSHTFNYFLQVSMMQYTNMTNINSINVLSFEISSVYKCHGTVIPCQDNAHEWKQDIYQHFFSSKNKMNF